MAFFLHKIPWIMTKIYPDYLWKVNTDKKVIYLTFDDGPIPEITEFVLDTLKKYQAKATFFCIGDNIRKHPHIFENILAGGHQVGNHTFNHLNGWKTETNEYVENVENGQQIMTIQRFTDIQRTNGQSTIHNPQSHLFRPPYGRITHSQAKILQNLGYKIIMWDVLSGDFSPEISPEKCLQKTIQSTESGSIVVFHDSIKASKNMIYALPKFLEHFIERNFKFEVLSL